MKSEKSWWGIVGAIALESIAIIDLAVDLYTGKKTYTELLCVLTFCAISAVVFIYIIKRNRRKSRGNNK